jgi:hypothetical protein
MQIKNITGNELDVPALDRIVGAGEVVTCPDDVGLTLIEQVDVWVSVEKGKTNDSTI